MRVLFDFFINIARWAWMEAASLEKAKEAL